jgi:hypothetical protein
VRKLAAEARYKKSTSQNALYSIIFGEGGSEDSRKRNSDAFSHSLDPFRSVAHVESGRCFTSQFFANNAVAVSAVVSLRPTA